MPPPQRWQGPGALPRERPGSVRCLAGPCRAAPGTCAARAPQRPSAQATQDPPVPTRAGGAEGAPAPAVPLLWPPSAGASAAPDHPLWGWPVQGQSERGEDRAARRKRGERSRGRRAACREPAKRVVRRHDKGVGADGGGVNPPTSPGVQPGWGWRGACPSRPVERPAARAGGEWRDKSPSRRLFSRQRAKPCQRLNGVQARGGRQT